MLIGRDNYLQILDKLRSLKSRSLVVVYGRRRIGKSFICLEHLRKHGGLAFEGLENQRASFQFRSMERKLRTAMPELSRELSPARCWEDVLDMITLYFKHRDNGAGQVLLLDEYQWLAAGRSSLTALIKRYWDNEWSKLGIQLILCGSIASYMIKRVIKSKALYGRIDSQLHVTQLSPQECASFFSPSTSPLEIIKHLTVFGGVPKYLADIQVKDSFEKNIQRIFFQRESPYIDEFEKIFYSQFKAHRIYQTIVSELSSGPKDLKRLSEALQIPSGGGLKSYLDNLKNAEFITSNPDLPTKLKTKQISYRLSDPFIRFYLYFIQPNVRLILESNNPEGVFTTITSNKLNVFLGLAFENYCTLNALLLAEILGFQSEVTAWGPLRTRGQESFQVDLLYVRKSKIIVLCEVKFSSHVIEPQIIAEVELKLSKLKGLFPEYSIQKCLITTIGPSKSLAASGYFEHNITAAEILSRK